jgi:hypothetical protein
MIRIRIVVLASLAVAACQKSGEGPKPSASSAAPAVKPSDKPPEPAAKPAPAPPRPEALPDLPEKMAASHILYMYKGSMRAPETVTRSKDEAKKAAEAALAKLKGGAKFEELAKAESDCPSKNRGGSLGTFPPRMMHPEFAKAAAALQPGGLSNVVETPFGFHVIRREKVEEIRASHILYMYKGSMRAPATVTRTKDEAQKAAEAALAKIKAGAKLADIAAAESDCPSKKKGGDLGSFGRGLMAPPFEQAAFALKTGEVSGVVETKFGFHVIQRTN